MYEEYIKKDYYNNKRYYLLYVIILVILIIITLFIYDRFTKINSPNTEIIEYNLSFFGPDELDIPLYSVYEELGYYSYDSNGFDYTKFVFVDSNLNVNKIGIYTITYTLVVNNNEIKKIERKINVYDPKNTNDNVENPIIDSDSGLIFENTLIKLIGYETINLNLNEKYIDEGVLFTIDGEDKSKYIKVVNNVNSNIVGNYKITYEINYQNIKKTLVRNVYVYDFNSYFTIDNSNLTNTNINIIYKNDSNIISYITLPNLRISDEKKFNYSIDQNGQYKFMLYDKNGKRFDVSVKINNIDKISPTGICTAVLKSGKTTYTIASSDQDIDRYVFNNNNEYTSFINTYVINEYIRGDNKVTIYDKAGNYKNISCTTTMKIMNVIKPSSNDNVKYKAESKNMSVYVIQTSKYYITRIWAADPYNQFKKYVSDDYGKNDDSIANILNKSLSGLNIKNKIAVGSNSDVSNRYGYDICNSKEKYTCYSMIIHNGKILKNNPKETSIRFLVYGLTKNNELKYYHIYPETTSNEKGKLHKEMLDDGLKYTYGAMGSLVQNNKSLNINTGSVPVYAQIFWRATEKAARQSICQVDENNFLYLTTTSSMSNPEVATELVKLGCKTGLSLDGGGSTTLFYKNSSSNNWTSIKGTGVRNKMWGVTIWSE